MEKEISKTNPVEILALHVAEMSGIEFLEKRNGQQMLTLYANARRYIKIRRKNLEYRLFCMMYSNDYDGFSIERFGNFGAILSADILYLLK